MGPELGALRESCIDECGGEYLLLIIVLQDLLVLLVVLLGLLQARYHKWVKRFSEASPADIFQQTHLIIILLIVFYHQFIDYRRVLLNPQTPYQALNTKLFKTSTKIQTNISLLPADQKFDQI